MNRRAGGLSLCSVVLQNFRGLWIAMRNISFIIYIIFQMFVNRTVRPVLSFRTVGFCGCV